MYESAVASFDTTLEFMNLGVKASFTEFIWHPKFDNSGFMILRRKDIDDFDPEVMYPAFTADELSLIIAHTSRAINQMLALTLSYQTPKVSDSLLQTLIAAVGDESIPVAQLALSVRRIESGLPLEITVLSQEDKAKVSSVMQKYKAAIEEGCDSALVAKEPYSILVKEHRKHTILAISHNGVKKALLVKDPDGNISLEAGEPQDLEKILNTI